MVRRTKTDALATRENILDSAELVFLRQGVSRTTLHDIAVEAGVTRGAIYWHFADKLAVFDAMLGRARMPLESALHALEQFDADDPLGDLTGYANLVFRQIEDDPKVTRVYEIATLKVEYVDELTAVRIRRAEMAMQWRTLAETRIRSAVHTGIARASVDPTGTALALWAIMDGLARAWLLAPKSFSLKNVGLNAIATHIDALRAA